MAGTKAMIVFFDDSIYINEVFEKLAEAQVSLVEAFKAFQERFDLLRDYLSESEEDDEHAGRSWPPFKKKKVKKNYGTYHYIRVFQKNLPYQRGAY
jgi:hypothetical protein